MKCPSCGLINPPEAIYCDCGHQFKEVMKPTMKCPNSYCDFLSPPDAIYCDCGYKFQKEEVIISDLIKLGKAQAHYNTSHSRILKYSMEMYHEGLKEPKLVTAPEIDMLENKVNFQAQKWVEKWGKLESKRRITGEKEANLEEAKTRSEEARNALEQIDNLLIHTLSIDDTVDWESLKKKESFSEIKPSKPSKESYKKYPPQPDKNSYEFIPTFTFIEKLSKSKKERKIQEYENRYSKAISEWEKQKSLIDTNNKNIDKEYESQTKKWEEEVDKWEKRKDIFLQKQKVFNTKID